MLKVNSIDKEHVKIMLDSGVEIDGFEGSFEIPLEALNLPVDELKITSDQDVTEDATSIPVTARECMRILYEDDSIAIVSTEKQIRPKRFMNASSEWLIHLAEVFGAENIHTRSETHERVYYLQVEERYLALSDDEKSVLLFALQAYTVEGEEPLQNVMEFEPSLIDKEISKILRVKEEYQRKYDILEAMTVDELEQYCRDNEISGYSSLNKAGIIDLIISSGFERVIE